VATNRGTYTELSPGTYTNFSLSGPGCYFLDAGIYQWVGGYVSHGGMVSNELKPPDEGLYSAPGTPTLVSPVNNFWGAGGCAGSFAVATAPVAGGQGLSHQGGAGNWGVEVTSVRYDRFMDNTVPGNVCFAGAGCMRESAPSACHQVPEIDASNQGIDVNITVNSPGAQYYNVYINPNGCLPYLLPTPPGTRNDFSFVNTYPAPAGAGTLSGGIAGGGWPCASPGVTLCNINYNNVINVPTVHTHNCNGQARTNQLCWAPDDETAPTCFASCPPAAAVPQENAPMSIEYAPAYTSGDVANENYCRDTLAGGDPTAPCAPAKITPGAVQFYMGPADCVDQNGNGYTHVFSGVQYNWIIIYQAPAVPPATAPFCNPNHLLGNALTQYIGTIYTPSSNWTIQGSDKSPLSGQVICWKALVTGAGQAGIDYNPNYAPAPPAARLIN
jgi:hypothetical protein